MKTFSGNQDALSLYCFSSIPQPGASVYFYDFYKGDKDGVKLSIKEINQISKKKDFKPIKTNSFDFTSFSDGAYPFYVSVNKFKRVTAIYFELRNNCGWGSNMFYERPGRLLQEKEMLKSMPENMQLDMTLAPAMSVNFKPRNRNTYFTFSHWEIDGARFVNNKKTIKKHLGYLDVKSNLIVLDDTGNLNRLDEKIDKKKIYDKAIKQKKYYGVDDGLSFERVFVPVKNKSYKVFIHYFNKTEKEEIKDLQLDDPVRGLVSPIFPIISIQDIDGCFLTKDKDGKLVFIKNKETKISEYLQSQIKKKNKNLKICQLDVEDLTSLSFVNKLNYKIDSISLVGFEHISVLSPLLKLKNVKKILFINCNISFEDRINGNHNKYKDHQIKIFKTLNQKKIITVLNGIIINFDVKQEQLEFDGGAYSGELNSSKGTAEGYGVLRLNDGSVYSGNFKDSKFHGYGSYILASGSIYLGEWKYGVQNGSAIFISKDGFRYTGNFKNNKYHGKGEFFIESTGETKIIKHNEGKELK